MSQQNVEAVRRQHEHFSRTGEVLSEIYEPEAEWMAAREDPDAATHRGLEAIRRYFAHWAGMFESIDLRAEELIDAGDRVFAWIRFAGKGAASGAPVEMEQAQIWTFRDGKVVRVEEYFDRTEALDVAGLSDEAMSQEKFELVKAVYSAINASDLVAAFRDEDFLRAIASTLEPLTDPEFTFVLAEPEFTGLGGVYEGHRGFIQAMHDWLSVWESYSNQPEEFIQTGEQVLVLASERGRTKTGGVEVEILTAFVWSFRLGKVLQVKAYQDRAKALEAVGLSEDARTSS